MEMLKRRAIVGGVFYEVDPVVNAASWRLGAELAQIASRLHLHEGESDDSGDRLTLSRGKRHLVEINRVPGSVWVRAGLFTIRTDRWARGMSQREFHGLLRQLVTHAGLDESAKAPRPV